MPPVMYDIWTSRLFFWDGPHMVSTTMFLLLNSITTPHSTFSWPKIQTLQWRSLIQSYSQMMRQSILVRQQKPLTVSSFLTSYQYVDEPLCAKIYPSRDVKILTGYKLLSIGIIILRGGISVGSSSYREITSTKVSLLDILIKNRQIFNQLKIALIKYSKKIMITAPPFSYRPGRSIICP